MKQYNLLSFVRGWLIGAFTPTLWNTDKFEVGIKKYKSGDYETAHYHKLSDEITVIVSGEVEMNGKTYVENDILVIEKNEKTDFRCLKDAVTVVIRNGSGIGDKYTD